MIRYAQVISDEVELERLKRRNNPHDKPSGLANGRCPRDDKKLMQYGDGVLHCNCCGRDYPSAARLGSRILI